MLLRLSEAASSSLDKALIQQLSEASSASRHDRSVSESTTRRFTRVPLVCDIACIVDGVVMLGANRNVEAAKVQLSAAIFRAVEASGPTLKSMLAGAANVGESALTDGVVSEATALLYPHLPLPLRMVFKQQQVLSFLCANRALLISAAAEAGRVSLRPAAR